MDLGRETRGIIEDIQVKGTATRLENQLDAALTCNFKS